MSRLPSIDDVDVSGKVLLIRADLNVPARNGAVTDATRLERFAPTVKDLAGKGARVVILAHFGRPKGRPDPEFTLKPVAEKLGEILGTKVAFAADCIGEPAKTVVSALRDGDVAVLENLRFHAEEEANDEAFAGELASLGDIYVNDAFSCAHRAHASTHALAKRMPAYAGPSLLAEVNALESALNQPQRPVAAVVGGAKVSTKIGVLEFLVPKMDHLVIGGGMANTFLAAQGLDVGKSLFEADARETALRVMRLAEGSGCKLHLPTDVAAATEFKAHAEHDTVAVNAIPADRMALDVGPETAGAIIDALSSCRTLLWNGPLGAFEIEPFDAATNKVALAAAKLTRDGRLVTVAGGGDTVAALNASGAADDFTYLSTAGGAFLEWLEGRELPGIEVLRKG